MIELFNRRAGNTYGTLAGNMGLVLPVAFSVALIS
jgi:hypothetical protein